jgi:hypothetical protein
MAEGTEGKQYGIVKKPKSVIHYTFASRERWWFRCTHTAQSEEDVEHLRGRIWQKRFMSTGDRYIVADLQTSRWFSMETSCWDGACSFFFPSLLLSFLAI